MGGSWGDPLLYQLTAYRKGLSVKCWRVLFEYERTNCADHIIPARIYIYS